MCNVPVRRSENTLDDSPLWHYVTASRTNVGNRTTESSQVNPSGIQSLRSHVRDSTDDSENILINKIFSNRL